MADNPAEGIEGPGADLRSAREARGLSVHQVAVELHVSDTFINALERGDYTVLGEPVFVRGHLRNYARAVGVPEGQVLGAYEQAQNKPTSPKLVTQHSLASGMNLRTREWTLRAASGAVVIVLLVLAGSWWERRPDETAVPSMAVTQPVSTPAPSTAPAPVATLTDLADNQAPAQKPAGAQKETPKPAEPAAPQTRLASTEIAPVTHVQRTNPPATPVSVESHAQQAVIGPGEAKNLTHVKFTLGAASWIEVYDNNGKRLYYDLAPAGDSLELSGAGPLQVFLGNAPGVSIELNGAPFDLKPYARTDNTARFKLGEAGN
ncbi:MAG TPA: RodZ domain-containing protein [Gammaproteobacteria bacterium]|nr:RodZ domain-containing protein [Gammaproteobacteria bacterium]